MTEENTIRLLRAQAWERAKGELRSVSAAFFGETSARPGQFDEFDDLMETFVSSVEQNGLAE